MQTDKLYTFEDPRASTKDTLGAFNAAQEWLEVLERARDLASSRTQLDSYVDQEDNYRGLPSTYPNQVTTPGSEMTGLSLESRSSTQPEIETVKRKRFSKRHSKNGLTAVF